MSNTQGDNTTEAEKHPPIERIISDGKDIHIPNLEHGQNVQSTNGTITIESGAHNSNITTIAQGTPHNTIDIAINAPGQDITHSQITAIDGFDASVTIVAKDITHSTIANNAPSGNVDVTTDNIITTSLHSGATLHISARGTIEGTKKDAIKIDGRNNIDLQADTIKHTRIQGKFEPIVVNANTIENTQITASFGNVIIDAEKMKNIVINTGLNAQTYIDLRDVKDVNDLRNLDINSSSGKLVLIFTEAQTDIIDTIMDSKFGKYDTIHHNSIAGNNIPTVITIDEDTNLTRESNRDIKDISPEISTQVVAPFKPPEEWEGTPPIDQIKP